MELKQKCISEFSNVVRGGSPRPAGDSRYFNGNFIPWLTVADLTNIPSSQLRVNKTESFLTAEGSSFSRMLEKDTLIIANSGATLGVAKILDIKCCANDGIAALLDISFDVDIVYLCYYINSLTKQLREKIATGIGQPNLNTTLIGSIEVALPPLPEQKVIAQVLSHTDELISSLEKLIEKKKLIKQGTMQQLLTGKKRLPGFSGEWEVKKFTDVCNLVHGYQFRTTDFIESNNGIKVIKIGNVFENYLETNECDYINQSRLSLFSSYVINSGDILMSLTGNIGRVVRVRKINEILLQNYRVGKFVPKNIDPDYLTYSLSSPNTTSQLIVLANQAAQANFGKQDFDKVFVFVPPDLSEQKAISKIIEDMNYEIEALQQKLNKYKAIKQGMMENLLTGKIRLVSSAKNAKIFQIQSKKPQHNWEFNEAVIVSVFVNLFSNEKFPLGRKRSQKTSYLFHKYVDRKAQGYLKKVAGPYNPKTKYGGPEKIARNNGYIKYHSRGNYNGYLIAENIKEALEYFYKWYGQDKIEWLEQFRYVTNDKLELWTTVDMAIEDLVKEDKEISLFNIKTVIANNKEWQDKLKRPIFSDENIESAIEKLQELFGGF